MTEHNLTLLRGARQDVCRVKRALNADRDAGEISQREVELITSSLQRALEGLHLAIKVLRDGPGKPRTLGEEPK